MTGLTTRLRQFGLFAAIAAIAVMAAVCHERSNLRGQTAEAGATDRDAITISADIAHQWSEDGVQIAVLRGRCRIRQGSTVLTSRKMVVRDRRVGSRWETRHHLAVYLEDDVRVDRPGSSTSDSVLVIRLVTRAGVTSQFRSTSVGDATNRQDPLYVRARRRLREHRGNVVQTTGLRQQQPPALDPLNPEFRSVQIQTPPGDMRRVFISPRSAVPYSVFSFLSKQTTPPEQVWVLTGGINIVIQGAPGLGTVDLSADRMVIWTSAQEGDDLPNELVQERDTPFQVYLEGNIVIRQGGDVLGLPESPSRGRGDFEHEDLRSLTEQQRLGQLGEIVLRAAQAVYDAREERALLLNAELKTFIPQLNGDVRMRAERIRQLARNSFHAQNAWLSPSRFAVPGYRLQASDIFYEPRIVSPFTGPTGGIDPVTGQPIVTEVPWITSLNNAFFIDDVPLFYAPYLAAPAEDPNIPLRRVEFGHDRIFGGQVETVWNMFTILGLEEPDGVRWDLLADVYTERGPAVGTQTEYVGGNLFGIPGTYVGRGLAYAIHDSGRDNLGELRKSLEPENEARGRVLFRHRHSLPAHSTLIAEIGLVSDRNFLEQYFEEEFDEDKDNETLGYFKQQFDNFAWTVLARPQVNDFENTTEWLPRGDLYLLSEPLAGGLVTWSTHTSAGYGTLEPAAAPSDPLEVFSPLPFVAGSEGAVLMSRHELTLPLNAGPVNVVPFALGEAAFWQEDFTGDSDDRLVASAGIRSSIQFWRVFPFVQSRVLNLNGLAHKIRLQGEYAWTDSSKDLAEIPQFNEFDDNAQERFRQRLIGSTFGALPPVFEPRSYAVRTGAGRYVTAPYHELVDDQQVLRLALRQRLQTKVGPPDRLRIKDWMTLDVEASVFPNADRDNFGEEVGLLGGDYRWNLGDRTTLLASAYYDLFEGGQELWNVGLLSQRTRRGNVYLGVRQVRGAGLESQILSFSYSYHMSPKWISTFGTSFNLGEDRNVGQSLTLTRVGADFLLHLGLNFDESKDNAGIALAIEPRIAPFNDSSTTQLGSLLGGDGTDNNR